MRSRSSSKMCLIVMASAAVLGVTSSSGEAAVLTDFAIWNNTTPSASAIDRTGGTAVTNTAQNATAEATLEGRTDLRVLQDFRQSAGQAEGAVASGGTFTPAGGTNNIYAFTATALPDIRINPVTNWRSNSGAPSSGGTSTAGVGEGVNILNTSIGDVTFDIQFGSYDGTNFSTSSATAVRAAGFTMSGLDTTTLMTAVFYSSTNEALSTQTFTPSGAANAYFGHVADLGKSIQYVRITRGAAAAARTTALGDVAFTTVPEPACLALAGLAGLGLLRRRGQRG